MRSPYQAPSLDNNSLDSTLESRVVCSRRPRLRVMERGEERWILADAAVERYVRDLNKFKQTETIKGVTLVGRRYQPLFPYFREAENMETAADSDDQRA